MKESDYFEMRGFGKTQVEGKKMKDETEKERVARRLKNIIHNTGRIEVKSCETCGRCEESCSNNCGGCVSFSRWVPIDQEPSLAEQLCHTAKTGQVEQDYRGDSVISVRKSEIEKLVNAHWNYMEKVLTTAADKTRLYNFDEVMEMRKWDYTSSAIHFYGHGYEDGQGAMAQTALDRLKEA